MHKLVKIFPIALIAVFCMFTAVCASTRTLETRFALSADARSEFSTSFPLLSAGRIIVEANWNSPAISRVATSLTLILIRPDGTTAASKSGTSVLRLDLGASDQDVEKFAASNEAKWTVKILNDANANRTEVSGTLRITIPAASRTLEDTQFTLLGSGNAQEIPFNVPAPGRIQVDVSWGPDVLARPSDQVTLVVSLIHPGESRTYARRQGTSPIRVEQQVTEQTLDLGVRWVVRVQNDTQTKVKGRIEITYTPSL
ncbi:MAG: hypothetical protein M3Y84_10235 [Acidobacteriota bacterium]|nr:hypothetical protein [Acidobacteriota bacterium]